MQVKLKVFRFNPQSDKEPRYDTFTVDAKPTDRMLDCLNKVRWEQDGSLAYRMSCAHGICGSDGMTINGVSALACQKLVKDYDARKRNSGRATQRFCGREGFGGRLGAVF